MHRFKKGSGLPIKAPVIDMIEIGAGGGSIAAIDEVGLLKVGPHSAGADPGPACYGRGGTSRPSPTPTSCSATTIRASSSAAGWRSTRRRPKRALATRRRSRSGCRASRPPGASTGRHREHGGGRARAPRREGQGPAPLRHGRLRRRRAGARRRGRARARRARGDHPAGLRRGLGARLPRRAAVLRAGALAARSCSDDAGFDAAASTRCSTSSRRTAARASPRPASRPQAVTVERSADMRLVGQMHEITVPLPDGADRARRACRRSARPSPRPMPRATPRCYEGAEIEAISLPRALSAARRRSCRSREAGAAAHGRGAQGHASAYFGGGLRRGRGLRPLRARARRPHRRTGHHRGARGDDGRAARATSLTVDEAGNLRIARRGAARAPRPSSRPTCRSTTRCARIEADPIALEIMWSRLVTVVEEMWLHGRAAPPSR